MFGVFLRVFQCIRQKLVVILNLANNITIILEKNFGKSSGWTPLSNSNAFNSADHTSTRKTDEILSRFRLLRIRSIWSLKSKKRTFERFIVEHNWKKRINEQKERKRMRNAKINAVYSGIFCIYFLKRQKWTICSFWGTLINLPLST